MVKLCFVNFIFALIFFNFCITFNCILLMQIFLSFKIFNINKRVNTLSRIYDTLELVN